MGDMSLVGTRPPTVDEYENTPEQKRRLSFKPGITGFVANQQAKWDQRISMKLLN